MSFFSRLKRGWKSRGNAATDIQNKLLKDRIVFLSTPIDDQIANLIIAQLLYLEAEDASQDINFYVNSPGGAVPASMAIYDTINSILPDVTTVCMGSAAGVAALLVAAGARGKRFALPNASFQFVPFRIGKGAPNGLEKIQEVYRIEQLVIEEFEKCTNRPRWQLRDAFRGEISLTAEDAIRFGLIDEIVRGPGD